MILKEESLLHQFICGIYSENNILGCIDPSYRMGKPLKYELDSRQMILALCDQTTMSNFYQKTMPLLHNFPKLTAPKHFKIDKVQLIPLINAQRPDVHYTFRPFIEYNQVDMFSRLRDITQALGLDQLITAPPELSHKLLPRVEPPPKQHFDVAQEDEPLPRPRLGVFEAFCGPPGPVESSTRNPFDFNCFMGVLPK